MASNDFNANLQSPPMKTLLGRKNAMSGESPPDSFGKTKRNKSSSPTGGKNVQFEEQKEFEMQEMPCKYYTLYLIYSYHGRWNRIYELESPSRNLKKTQ
jgi:hypothetical protein